MRGFLAFTPLLWVLVLVLGACHTPPEGIPAPEVVTLPVLSSNSLQVVSVGDILLADASQKTLEAHGYDWPFKAVQPLLSRADLILGNLEGPITDHKKKLDKTKGYAYRARKASAGALKRAGFHGLSLANNHILDFGVQGMMDTLDVVKSNGMVPFGAGAGVDEARRGVVFDLGGFRIGVLGYSEPFNSYKKRGWFAEEDHPGCAALTEEALKEDLARMKKHADYVVVSVHWGVNYQEVTPYQRRMGKVAIELGADLVNGHHPHIAQGIEIHQGKPILYSVGNFVFGTLGRYGKLMKLPPGPQGEHIEPPGYGSVARWFFQDKKLTHIAVTLIEVNNKKVHFQPQRVAAAEAEAELRTRVSRYQTPLRYVEDTGFLGFNPGWEEAPLPSLPFPGVQVPPLPPPPLESAKVTPGASSTASGAAASTAGSPPPPRKAPSTTPHRGNRRGEVPPAAPSQE